MNRDRLLKESKKWVEENIISEDQQSQILERYPKRQNRPLLLTFAAIFVGLGFLTFIASNWSLMNDIVRMGVILFFLLAFYLAGDWVYRKKSKPVGESLILIALLVFGAGIFLTGQMYHYMSFNAFPFFIWSLAGFGLYLLFKELSLFIATLLIMTVGQIYSSAAFQSFHLWMGLLFIVGISVLVYQRREPILTFVFGLSYAVQSLVFVLTESLDYYWLFVFFLLLYLVDDAISVKGQIRSLKTISIVAVFILNVFEVFFLGQNWMENIGDSSFSFFIIWAILFVFAVIRSAVSSTNYYWIDLILFVPVFRFAFGDVLSLGILFGYALLWLIFGYHQEIRRWINKGTAAFLITTFIAYFQLAWDFMNRSLFFFIGGLLLFMLSFFLERKRRQFSKGREAA
ncbi:DUF2157 domain-containing protein [Halobacillus fulvus]|nr:DUF2157 domain-containing protein [Halobacillus fulvus]